MSKEQQIQEEEYRLPYHYISTFRSGVFSQSCTDTWGINYVSTIEYLLERLQERPFSSIVDVGCGDGRLSREIAESFPAASVVGVDYSARAINLAKAMNPDAERVSFVNSDITKEVPGVRRDAAVLMEVLEHIPDDQERRFVAAVRNQVKDGGMLFLTVPHANKPLEPKHFRHYDSRTITASLAEHFEILEVVPFERRSPSRKVIDSILCNGYFVLNRRSWLNAVYRYYKRRLFHCSDESQAQRLFVLARAK